MTFFSCATCANQTADVSEPPPLCLVCADERQYVPLSGQQWTTLADRDDVAWELTELEPGLEAVQARPGVGIGQRGLLVQTPAGNVLWDPPGHLDDEVVGLLGRRGPIASIAVSHPHFYGCMVEYAQALDAPVLVAEDDLDWVQRSDPSLRSWRGAHEVVPGVTLVQCGGHFDGSAVLHWAEGADGRGALLVADTLGVVTDPRWLTFMSSFPNTVPLDGDAVRGVLAALEPLRYHRVYGAFEGTDVPGDGAAAVDRSARRYLRAIGDPTVH